MVELYRQGKTEELVRKPAPLPFCPLYIPQGLAWDRTQMSRVIKTSQLMLYREISAVCSQIHTKHINTLCGQNIELLNVKLAVHIVTTGL